MCRSLVLVYIQSVTAEIRQGKRRKKETTGQKHNGLPYSIGRPQERPEVTPEPLSLLLYPNQGIDQGHSRSSQIHKGGNISTGNISAEKYQNPFTYVKVMASLRWNVFETRCIQACDGRTDIQTDTGPHRAYTAPYADALFICIAR